MTKLVAGKPFRSRSPTLVVDNKLGIGSYKFQLVVVDDEGNLSASHELVVTVRPVVTPPRPTPPTPPS